VLAQLQESFPDDLRVIIRHYPLISRSDGTPLHDKAALAAQAVEAAGLQDKFFELHDVIYEKQSLWLDLTEEAFEGWLLIEASLLDIDVDQFLADMYSEAIMTNVYNAFVSGNTNGIPGTPYILLNDEPLPTEYYNFEALYSILESYLIPLGKLANKQFTECPEIIIDPAVQYTATLVTEKGDIVIALYPDVAPFTVNSFIFLAEHDYFDDVTFHRVLEGFMAQGGDPSGTGSGSPGYYFGLETSPDVSFDRAGLLAMANAGPTSNGSQFFITFGPTPHLDGSYTIFGEVISGMDVVLSLKIRNPQTALPSDLGDLIVDVIIAEN
jgi:cyclophilin family peptidyl-prolyl cis-trans isomerase